MKKTIMILIYILAYNHVSPQFGMGKLEDIERVKEVPLLVILQEKNEKSVKKISRSKKGDINEYYAQIKSYNSALKEGFGDTWTYSNDIKFLTHSELEEYNIKSNKRKYAYFKLHVEQGDNGQSLLESKGLIKTYHYGIYLTGEKKPVYSYMYSSSQPEKADFKFIAQQVQHYLSRRETLKSGKMSRKELKAQLNKNAHHLKNKTLLLDKEDLTENLISEIETLYKYDYRITTKKEIDESILNDDENIAYLKIVPVGQLSSSSGALKTSKVIHMQYIIDAKDGKIMAYSKPSSLSGLGAPLVMAVSGTNKVMKVADMKKIIKAIDG